MVESSLPRSIEADDSHTTRAPSGALVHQRSLEHSDRLARRLHEVVPGKVWTLVGNGLSNQSFVLGPGGVICIDTGESREEMAAALLELRRVCTAPLAAVLLTHFHYVGGTLAAFGEAGGTLPVYGHAGIDGNLKRAGGLIAPTYLRGLVEQFAIFLPAEGPDAAENVGLGRSYRDPAHAPHQPGYVPPSITFDEATRLEVAGLEILVDPAPSDADDSVTYYFPSLGVAVHNLVWPVLFNVFAIRGEEYRDPRVLVAGIDRLLALEPEALVGTHGPPIIGAAEVQRRATAARDAVQLLWDQTVRLANQGLTAKGIAERVRLPGSFDEDYLTQELYGLVEHHVRQIRSGLFGFFDGEIADLLPLPEVERRERLIAGFGGRKAVAAAMDEALAEEDLRWALELGAWLTGTPGASHEDRLALADALRRVARRTSAANIRSWCLTHALELEGSLDLSSLRSPRMSAFSIQLAPLAATLEQLTVLVEPEALAGIDAVVSIEADGETGAVHLRNGIIAPVGLPANPDLSVTLSKEDLGLLLSGQKDLPDAIAQGDLSIIGDERILNVLFEALDILP